MDNYVDRADRVIRELSEEASRNRYDYKMVTTSQIRKFLTEVNRISTELFKNRNKDLVSSKIPDKIPENLQMEIKFLKVRLAYQIGRAGGKSNNPVRDFEDKAELFKEIDGIGDSLERYENFARYVEALVAFHKFYVGEED